MVGLVLVILLVLLLFGGGLGYGTYGGWAFSPLGIILLVVLILALTGRL